MLQRDVLARDGCLWELACWACARGEFGSVRGQLADRVAERGFMLARAGKRCAAAVVPCD